MKLEQLNEAKYYKSTRLAWVEMGESRGHSFSGKAVVTLEELDHLAHLDRNTDEGEDAFEDYFMEKDLYSVSEVFDNWKDVKNSIQTTGEASGILEEGSYGISAKGMKRAKQLAALAYHEMNDDDEEDWY